MAQLTISEHITAPPELVFGVASDFQLEDAPQVSRFDPPHGYVLECSAGGCDVRVQHKFVGDIAGTHVRLTLETVPRNWRAKLFERLFTTRALRNCLVADLEDLKRVAEAKAREEESAGKSSPHAPQEA
jgi:hypothetical protein